VKKSRKWQKSGGKMAKKGEDGVWKIKKGWGLLAVVAAMVVALAGGAMGVYAIPQSTISSSFTVSPRVIHPGATMAYDNWGSNATRSSAATPASSDGMRARIHLGDVGEMGINFKVKGKDFHLENAYRDLKIQINLYMEGENTEVWKGENVILWPVKEGIAYNVENRADNYGACLATGLVYDCVIHIFENTENVSTAITVDIPIHLEVVVCTVPRVETR